MESSSYHHLQDVDLLGSSCSQKFQKKGQTWGFRIFGWNRCSLKSSPKSLQEAMIWVATKTPPGSTNKWLAAPKTSIPPSSIGKITSNLHSMTHNSPPFAAKPWSCWFLGCNSRISQQSHICGPKEPSKADSWAHKSIFERFWVIWVIEL